ncbi:MAG: ricin-type beta-trefoil lectin domain protein [Burkholderiaceae bacterium]
MNYFQSIFSSVFSTQLPRVLAMLICLVSVAEYATAAPHTVMLRGVYVVPEWSAFSDTDGWTQQALVKESSKLRYLEFAIWEETKSVHLYEFPNDYDAFYSMRHGVTQQEAINYREQYAVSVAHGMPGTMGSVERSTFLLNAFKGFASHLVARYPNSNHAFSYEGHGSPGGALFQGQILPRHAQEFLQHWTQTLGRKLAFVDMGGPCSKGSFADLTVFCSAATYYLASDIPNGGYNMDNYSYENFLRTDPTHRYHDLLASEPTVQAALKKRIALKQTKYELSRTNMTREQIEQSNYLYSCDAFRELYARVLPIQAGFSAEHDLRTILLWQGGQHVPAFDATIIAKADNKSFFNWQIAFNGILAPSYNNGSSWYDQVTLSNTQLPSNVSTALEPNTQQGNNGGTVTVYQHSAFGGTSWSIGEGTHDANKVIASPVGNDEISSIRIQPGYSVEACQHGGGAGNCVTYNSSIQYVGSAMNDQISYLRVFASGSQQTNAQLQDAVQPPVQIGNSGTIFRLVATGSGKCIDASDGNNVVQRTCSSSGGQRFSQRPNGDGFSLVAGNGQCLDVAYAYQHRGAKVITYACHLGANQRFYQQGNSYRLSHSNRCLDTNDGSLNDGASLIQWDCTNGRNQQFSQIQ